MAHTSTFLVVLGTLLANAVDAGGADAARVRFVWADFDGDTLEDVYVVRPEEGDSLFRNRGDGSFEDVTATLPCVSCASVEVTWRDVDGDGDPDLLRLLVSGGVELLSNGGGGAFADVTQAAGLDRVTASTGARWLDYDADGHADIQFETEGAPLLFHNLGYFLFEPVTLDGGRRPAEPEAASTVRAIPGVLDDVAGPSAPQDDGARGSTRAGSGVPVLSGSLVDEVHPDPLVTGTPPVDPLEPNPEVDSQMPPFGNRCAWSVKDTATGDCVLVSSEPTLGKLFPMSADLFVATSGNVGVGTTSPTATLDVDGTARVTDTLTLAPSGDQALDVSTGSIYKGGALFIHTKGGLQNTAIGRLALANVTGLSGGTLSQEDTAVGYRALYSTLTAHGNTAIGSFALEDIVHGHSNTACGAAALSSNTGDSNTALGRNALASNTTGDSNTSSGVSALGSNTSGNLNTGSGFRTLFRNTTGSYNTANGARALYWNIAGQRNTASGYSALRFNTGGSSNTANGSKALYSNTTGSRNTANGELALFSNVNGYRNTATGYRALHSNIAGSNNTADGQYALASNIGSRNTASGSRSLFSNTTGRDNTASGYRALFANTNGEYNTASGSRSLSSNTTGTYNTASGYRALFSNTTGGYNTAKGFDALRYSTIGNNNTAVGNRSLNFNTTGSRNIALGNRAGSSLTTGSDNIAIGNNGFAGDGATIRIGALGTHTRAFVAGIRGVTTGDADAIPVVVDSAGQLGTVSSSRRFKKDIADMGDATERLLELRPVTFRYKQEQAVPAGEVPVEYGLIAEEVAEVFPDLVVYDEEGLPFTVKYHLLASMLLNELKKNDACDRERERELESEIAELREELTDLRAFSPRALPASAPASNL